MRKNCSFLQRVMKFFVFLKDPLNTVFLKKSKWNFSFFQVKPKGGGEVEGMRNAGKVSKKERTASVRSLAPVT